MPDVYVLRVFLGPDGRGGNPLGVVFDGDSVAREHRQRVATDLAFSETVFIDSTGSGTVEIYTPRQQLPFAGHPLVGTSWLLHSKGIPARTLRPGAGEVTTWQDDSKITWIRGRSGWVHPMTITQYDSPAAVDALSNPPEGTDFLYVWAWRDEPAGEVRSRHFAPGAGIAEDEATGAAAVLLTHQLGRALDITQGSGSQLLTRPGPDATVDVGGRVVLDDAYPLP